MLKTIFKRMSLTVMAVLIFASAAIGVIGFANPKTVSAADTAFENSIKGFPESYKPYLRNLHAKYPKWTFTPYNTNVDFDTVIKNEYKNQESMIEISYNKLLKSTLSDAFKNGSYITYDAGKWVPTSYNCMAYFIDPRHFLEDKYIYMFEKLNYDSKIHTKSGTEAALKGTFMYDQKVGYITTAGKYTYTDKTYSQAILDAASYSGVSPYFIAAKIKQKIGGTKNSTYAGMGAHKSVCGNYSTQFRGYYNFFNIGCYSSANPILHGLEFASSGSSYLRPWNTPFKSISGGAKYIGDRYINGGQNTIYFQKFNVRSDGTYSRYTHQYMTNIYGAAAEALNAANAYEKVGGGNMALNFIIPVYKNMPDLSNKITKYGTSSTKRAKIREDVNVRKGPSTSYASYGAVLKNADIEVLGGVRTDIGFSERWITNPYWYKIKAKVGSSTVTGYVSTNYVNFYSEYTMKVGEKYAIPVTASKGETYYYLSENPSVASIDDTGKVTAVKAGITHVHIFSAGGTMASAKVTVSNTESNIIAVTTKLKLDRSSATMIIGNKLKLKTTLTSSYTPMGVTYSSSDTAVATVASDGTITAKGIGPATITAKTTVGGVTAKCSISVHPKVTGVSKMEQTNTTTIKLTWAKNANATGYEVYRSLKAGTSGYSKIATISNASTTSYLDKNLKVGTTYYYRLKAITKNKYGTYASAFSNAYSMKVITASLKLAKNSATLTIGKSGTVKATVTSNYADKSVKYTSSDTNIATVDNTGKITAKKIGKVVITAKCNTGGGNDKCNLVVHPEGSKIESLKQTATTTTKLTWKKDANATGYEVYRSLYENKGYEKLASIGKATLNYTDKKVSVGKTYFYRVRSLTKTSQGTFASGYLNTVSIKVIAASLKLDKNSLTAIKNSTYLITPKVTSNYDDKTASFSSSDPSVATVDEHGLITAVKVGTAVITAKCNTGGGKDTCVVNVHPRSVAITDLDIPNKNSIRVSWSKSSDATYYEVYRSTKEGSGYSEIAVVSGATNYTDDRVSFDTRYYYRVKAVYKKGSLTLASGFSPAKSAAITR